MFRRNSGKPHMSVWRCSHKCQLSKCKFKSRNRSFSLGSSWDNYCTRSHRKSSKNSGRECSCLPSNRNSWSWGCRNKNCLRCQQSRLCTSQPLIDIACRTVLGTDHMKTNQDSIGTHQRIHKLRNQQTAPYLLSKLNRCLETSKKCSWESHKPCMSSLLQLLWGIAS
jgi:hypothetical protein